MNLAKKKENFIGKMVNIFTNRMLFSAIYLIMSILWYFPTLGAIFDYPKKILFVWGIVIIGYDILTKRICFRGYKSWWLVLFSAMFVVTILFNMDRMYGGIKHLIYNSILLFVIYPLDYEKDDKVYKKAFIIINDIFVAIIFIASAISILMYAIQYSLVFTRGETTLAIGVYYNRLYGVYTSANIGAVFSVVAIFLSVITYILDKKHFLKFKWFYIINAVIQFLYYSATLSKGGYLAIFVGISAVIALFVSPYLFKRFKSIIAICLIVVCLASSLLVLQGATFASRKTMLFLPKIANFVRFVDDKYFSGNDGNGNDFIGDFDSEDSEISLERVEQDGDATNGRLTIWGAGIALLKDNPLFGVAEADIYNGDTLIGNIDESKLTELNISELKRVDGYLHNAIIQILVYSGIIGLLIFLIFAVSIAKGYIVALKKFYGTKTYNIIASIFVLLTVFISQMVSESHMLFCRQSPHAITFWLYLGFAMFCIYKENHKKTDESLFVCDTPYQVVNAINLAKDNKNSDIYIYDQFSTAKSIAKNLKETNIFNNVILVKKYKHFNGAVNKLLTLFRIFAPEYTLKKHIGAKGFRTNYKTVYVSFFTQFTDLVRLSNPQAEFVQYEDGLGSYYIEDLEKKFRSNIFKFVNNFILNGKMSYNIDKLYLNHPECYDGNSFETVETMPAFAKSEILEKVFDYKENDLYKKSKFVYLTQPLRETAIGEKADIIENEILSVIKDSVVLRVHPRQDKEKFSCYSIDDVGNLWEIECARQLTDSHVLVSAFSTAQFTPKMLFNKEPTIVFTYELFGDFFENAEDMVQKLRTMYKNPDKIIIVKDLDELRGLLSQFGE